MNAIRSRLSKRLAYSFCQHKMLSPFTIQAPVKHRVMSTNQWPAPYYQRIFRSYPIRKEKEVSLLAAFNLEECTWLVTKSDLERTLNGRKVLDYAQNRMKSNTYLLYKQDSSSLVKGYVDDIAQFLDLAQKQNRRILSTTNLL